MEKKKLAKKKKLNAHTFEECKCGFDTVKIKIGERRKTINHK